MISVFIIFGILSAVALSGFFSGIETAIYSVNSIDLQIYAAKGCRKNQRVLKILENKSRLITTMLIGTNLAIFIATNLLTNFLNKLSLANTELLTTLILTPFCFIFAESLPKRIAFGIANKALVTSAGIINFFEITFLPLSYILGALGEGIRLILAKIGLKDLPIAGRVRLFENFEAKLAEGGLSPDQYQLAAGLISLESIFISKFMLKTNKTFTVNKNITCEEAGREIIANKYARALLTDKKNKLTGDIVTINSIITHKNKGNYPVYILGEKAVLLPKNMPILHAISTMRKKGARIAIVIDKKKRFIGTIQLNTLINSIISFK